jgi:hypothetical protein
MKTMWKVVVAAACLAIVLSGCGGGGGGAALTRYSLWITGPSSSRTYQIDNPAVNLSGGSFVPEGAECTGNFGAMPNGYQITWRNATNGVSGSAISSQAA